MFREGYKTDRKQNPVKSPEDRTIEYFGLTGLVNGEPTILYHGTTVMFDTFDIERSRLELVDRFYGPGIFLTPSKYVASKYADANRNVGFSTDIIMELKELNPEAGDFLHLLYLHGDTAWDMVKDVVNFENRTGVDPNDLDTIAGYIIGSRIKPVDRDEPWMFSTQTGAPDWLYNTLDEIGLNSDIYRPKIYTARVELQNPLVTSSKVEARKARAQGYDSVIFIGEDLVDNVPEVAVFDPNGVEILGVDVL